MNRTVSISLGPLAIDCPVPITSAQRRAACGLWWSASEDLQAIIKTGGSMLAFSDAEQEVERCLGGALIRLTPADHPLRARVRELAAAGEMAAFEAAGAELVESLAAEGVTPGQIADTVWSVLRGGGTPPTQAQVDAVLGNDAATPS